ncbi:MAG: DUF2243 domain-containing protein [Comamonadaceae bacterium]|nr:MAG: DUF2243 domain-containing protein [Comamonadaceae bacterium]
MAGDSTITYYGSIESFGPGASAAPPRAGAVLLGIALSGFFDGILLHQVLQWHHLLSGVSSPAMANFERQVLADGLFHLLMYLVAAIGLGLLWRGRAALAPGAGSRWLAGGLLIGFGLWNLIDVVAFHWLLGLHRVRMDTDRPLGWDLLWFVAFGLLPFALGWSMARRPGRSRRARGAARRRDGVLAWALLAVAIASLGAWAARPPAGDAAVLAWYPPGTSGASVMRGVDAVDGRVMWVNASGTLWALDVPTGRSAAPLYRAGAWFAQRAGGLAACAAWVDFGPKRGSMDMPGASAAPHRPDTMRL